MRGADSGMWSNICALPAFWVGLLYDQTSLDAATALAADIGPDDVMAARLSVATDGFNGTLAGHRVYELASQLVALSREGLQRRAITDSAGNDESGFLSPLGDCLQTQMTPAEALVHQLHGGWGGDLSKIFTTNSF